MVWCGGRVGGGEGGVRSIVRGGAGLGQNHKTELLGLGLGRMRVTGGEVEFIGLTGPPTAVT